MFANIKSSLILKIIFSSLKSINCLKIIRYNKFLQNKLSKNINSYKELSPVYRIIDKNGNVQEYDKKTNELIFEGKIKNGKWNGLGKIYKDDKIIFEGIFLNGKEWEGKGTIYYYNESINHFEKYIGNISEGKMNGEGKKFSEYGRYVFEEYLEYEGNFMNGKKSGYGKEFNPKKDLIYEGEFLNDKRNGQGKEYRLDEIIFEGQFLKGEKWEGFGKEYSYDDNLIFEGEYKNGKRNGKGKKYYNNKNNQIKFFGNYLEGKKEGEGINYYQNGKIKFKGNYSKGGKLNGKGYYINGELMYEIKNGEGKIKIFDEKNRIIFDGEYKNGKRRKKI